MKSAQETSSTFSNLSSGFRKAGAGIAAAAQLAGASLPSLGVAAVGTAAFSASTQRGDSAVMLAPGTSLPGQAYIDAGAQYSDYMVAIKRISASGVVSYATGIKLNSTQVLLPAHVIDSLSGFRPAERLAVLGGTNFYNPDYNISVSSYVTHPSYISGSNSVGGSVYDMAILTTTVAMPGSFAELATNAILNGSTITYAGYGMPGITSASATTHDGLLRAFQGISTGTSGFLFDDSIYGATFASASLGLNLPGTGSIGDSGAAGFIDGNKIGFMATSTSGDSFTFGIDLTTNEARSFINANIPEPTSISLTMAAIAAGLLIRNRKNNL